MNLTGAAPSRLYSNVKQALFNFRASIDLDLNSDQKSEIQSFITSLSKCEEKILKLKADKQDTDLLKINKLIGDGIDAMHHIIAEIRQNVGRKDEL